MAAAGTLDRRSMLRSEKCPVTQEGRDPSTKYCSEPPCEPSRVTTPV
eukprot:CAMPEP_0172538750 /NCGR_PEP_ID=MMETSP1067-20121228/10086_1 /TAXON_ID=265564 ORGANISM="Thalassiosira punctigera, Strain Tpunct2005C2" /NCGR_SAMPLE_ID=MMETSP1067 /ASSEMBLY_ACC=CAM_ASM_000444 /LENGTH=46 /DNA_ID= /DNA_START= /DNA_END= /DNA_ORIENTATION=